MQLVGFIIRIYHDARSPECQELALVTGDCYVCGTDPLIMQQLSMYFSDNCQLQTHTHTGFCNMEVNC